MERSETAAGRDRSGEFPTKLLHRSSTGSRHQRNFDPRCTQPRIRNSRVFIEKVSSAVMLIRKAGAVTRGRMSLTTSATATSLNNRRPVVRSIGGEGVRIREGARRRDSRTFTAIPADTGGYTRYYGSGRY